MPEAMIGASHYSLYAEVEAYGSHWGTKVVLSAVLGVVSVYEISGNVNLRYELGHSLPLNECLKHHPVTSYATWSAKRRMQL